MPNEEQLSILKRGVEDWNKWRKVNPEELINLRGANLSGENLSGAHLSGAILSGANLSRAGLVKAILADAKLDGANLSGANLSEAEIDGADLRSAQLISANLWRAELDRANLKGANLSEAKLDQASLMETYLSKAILIEAILSDAHLNKADLSGADLSKANLSGAFLDGANFSGAKLLRTKLGGAVVDRKTDFRGARVFRAEIDRYQLEQLNEYGGLTKGDLMDMDIDDGVVILRASYSGFKQWIHLIALGVFLFPYVWFVVSQWSMAKFISTTQEALPNAQMVFQGADGHMPLWKALGNFIYNGGINWQSGPIIHWSFWVFIFMLLYNLLRVTLLWKTKSLEIYQDASGFRARFSLKTSHLKIFKKELKSLGGCICTTWRKQAFM